MATAARRLVLLLPALVLLTIVVAIPAIQAVVLALSGDDGGFTLENLRQLFTDPALADALRNTLVLLVALLPVQAAIALALAFLLERRVRGSGALLSLIVLPLAVSDLAAGLLWLAVFTDRGYLSSALQGVGLTAQPVSWLGFDSAAGMVGAIVVAETWRTTGIMLLPLVTAIRGGNASRTLPLLRSSLGPALVLRGILALQTFAVVFALVGRNFPVLAGEAYTQLAANRDEHQAAAYVVVIVGVAILASAGYLGLARTRVPADR